MKTVEKIFYWLFAIFVIYIITEIIRKMLGGSLGFEEIIIALLVANIGYSFVLSQQVGRVNSRLSEHFGWHKGKENIADKKLINEKADNKLCFPL